MPQDDQKPFIYEGTTYVPLRYISENLGQSINWDSTTQTINIGEMEQENETYFGNNLKSMNFQRETGAFVTLGCGLVFWKKEYRDLDAIIHVITSFISQFTTKYELENGEWVPYPFVTVSLPVSPYPNLLEKMTLKQLKCLKIS